MLTYLGLGTKKKDKKKPAEELQGQMHSTKSKPSAMRAKNNDRAYCHTGTYQQIPLAGEKKSQSDFVHT